ncbi:hypothetical protein [Photorhabdus tasmaniensis]|uniref:Uncharacterized protein n=1 Tax=Photorhabdus tasmaniensis TaxID=1004159 RepID=A0ABX0GKV1_9GAMM|nr:hypothetical protein [Photorhabdus tasmaniensis]NHB89845.1 hypothetical protein [Photorhabdus tasmaniensis]
MERLPFYHQNLAALTLPAISALTQASILVSSADQETVTQQQKTLLQQAQQQWAALRHNLVSITDFVTLNVKKGKVRWINATTRWSGPRVIF